MSTPNTNSATVVPSPASKKIGSASTPLNQYSSPAPRSIPSPAALRKDHAAKTPINHPTGSSQGAKTVGATPMIASLSQQGSMASPAGGLLAGLTPTGLGVDLGTPSTQLGASMSISMSELGLTASGGVKRNEDEERRVKMRKILKSIGRAKGRVGEEGIARISRRVGFANDIDAEKLSAEERERRVGNRTISIAGNTTVIDVELKKHKPRTVQVLFSSDLAGGEGQSERAASILLKDIQMEPDKPYSTTLDSFSDSLKYLARLDHLSSSRLSCFDALSGIHRCLKRLEKQEMDQAKAEHPDFSDESLQTHVLNIKSGRPLMHEQGKMGLSIQYWTRGQQTWRRNKYIRAASKPHTIVIEARRCQAALYPPVRVSEAWLPDTFDLKSTDETAATIPWLDPPATYLGTDADSMTDDTTQALPDVRFIAKLEPPIKLPWQVAADVHTALGATVPPLLQMPPYLSLLLDVPAAAHGHLSATKTASRKQTNADGSISFVPRKHSYELSVAKHDVGFVLEELPFSHPRQLVELLPVLRQWACIGTLLQSTLGNVQSNGTKQPQISASDLLTGSLGQEETMRVEMTLAMTPVPTVSLALPVKAGLCSPEIQILENGKISIASGSAVPETAGLALEILQDLALWIEWIASS